MSENVRSVGGVGPQVALYTRTYPRNKMGKSWGSGGRIVNHPGKAGLGWAKESV